MYIKKLTIQGFKSYKDQVVVEPFSPGHNVVVGRNGSGKSNFFAAIRFVLNDAYTRLGQEERQALLHEGSGQPSISAFVEVVFDNADGRFPTGRDEVLLRRTIGLKKDEYSLDRKTVTKGDVMNLLQAAGFSRSNPYYIVPQGRVTALTNAQDAERLELLKEVAGTRVYEDHRQESLRILEETAGKQTRIVELLSHIEERLGELAEEKEALLRFQTLDRQKRTCELAILTREQADTAAALDRLETDLRTEDPRSTSAPADLDPDMQLAAIAQLERDLQQHRQTLQEAERDAEAARSDLAELQQQRAQLMAAASGEAATCVASAAEATRTRATLARLEDEIARKETELVQLRPQLDECTAALATLSSAHRAAFARETAVLARHSRVGQFATADERDTWINTQLSALQSAHTLDTEQMQAAGRDLESCHAKVASLETDMAELETAAVTQDAEANAAMAETRRARDVATDARRELWRAESRLQTALDAIADEETRAERDLAATVDRATWQGLAAVRRIAAATPELAAAVAGPLYELISVEDSVFRPAVETALGAALFHVVVADDTVATRLLEAMNRERIPGRVTFIPLNRITASGANADSDDEGDGHVHMDTQSETGADEVPLLDKIGFDRTRYQALFERLVGRAVLVPALDPATLARIRARRCTALTLTGDRGDRSGVLSGGSHDPRRSRLEAVVRLMQWRRRGDEHRALLADLQGRLLIADQHVTRTVAAAVAAEQAAAAAAPERRLAALALRRGELDSARALLRHKQDALAQLQARIETRSAESAMLMAELGQPLDAAPVDEDDESNREAPGRMDDLARRKDELEGRVAQLESLLEENLRRRRTELLARLAAVPRDTHVQGLRDTLATVETAISDGETRLAALNKTQETVVSAVTASAAELDRARAAYMDAERAATDRGSVFERNLSRRALLLQRRDASARRIRELNVLGSSSTTTTASSDSWEAHLQALSTPALVATLAECTATLRAAFTAPGRPPPSRKAADLHVAFSRQAETLRTRQAELAASAKAIADFVAVLDRRKDEATVRTFDQVADTFARVFERLCPTGHARLVLLREDVDTNPVFSGVAIRASFASKELDEGLLIGQLSGGQKSLLALALIFAIQLVDPAPFYLFDEIDANLDATARAAVADLIHLLASPGAAVALGVSVSTPVPTPAQFITTTFRPELLKHADAFFGVSFASRVSRVDSISRAQAVQFIEHDAN